MDLGSLDPIDVAGTVLTQRLIANPSKAEDCFYALIRLLHTCSSAAFLFATKGIEDAITDILKEGETDGTE